MAGRLTDDISPSIDLDGPLRPLGREDLARIRLALSRNVANWMRSGDCTRASDALTRWLRLDPAAPELWALKARALERNGALREAVEALKTATKLDPRSAWLVRLAGLAREGGDTALELASLARARRSGSLSIRQQVRLAELQMGARRYDDALSTLEEALAEEPQTLDLRHKRILCLLELGRRAEAATAIEGLVSDPDRTDEAICLWADLVIGMIRAPRQVVTRLGAALRSGAPPCWGIHAGLARALQALGRTAEALPHLVESVTLRPADGQLWYELGVARRHLGLSEAAQEAFFRSLSLAPDNARTLRLAGYEHRYADGDPALARVERALQRIGRYRKPAQVEVHYAAAKAFEDIGCTETAFQHYARAGQLQAELVPWSEDADRALLRSFRQDLSCDVLAEIASEGVAAPDVTFILGMPRSGTSLLDQLVSAHAGVQSLGELKLGAEVLNGLRVGQRIIGTVRGTPADVLRRLSQATPRQRASRYLAGVRSATGGAATCIIDKMPGNYHWLGLLTALLPGSRVLHCRRHPLDTCLSQYKLFFGDELPYTYRLDDLARAFRLYWEFMAFWREVVPPGQILDVFYEDLATEPERVTQEVLDHLHVPWSPASGELGLARKAVRTASAIQVRRPVDGRAIDQWRRVETHIAPLRDALADLVEAYEQELTTRRAARAGPSCDGRFSSGRSNVV